VGGEVKLVAITLAVVVAAPAFASCPDAPAPARAIERGAVKAAWWPEPAAIRVGQPFVLMLQLCPVDARPLRVDATMPEHRHGMNYKPSLHDLGGGRWRVEGMLWHMAGRWELTLDVASAGATQRLSQSVHLP
jgi:hypothetical protein